MKTPKMLKVMYNGEYLCNVYPHATRFQVFKYRLAIIMRKTLIVSFILGSIYGAFKVGRVTTSPVFVQAEDRSTVMYQEKIDTLKNAVMSKLSQCESAGHKESDGIIIFDTNNKASIGQFQWQVESVQHYYKLMTGKDISRKDAVILALNEVEARKLAKYVAFETNNKIGKDWVNCEKKYGLDAQVDIIKSME